MAKSKPATRDAVTKVAVKAKLVSTPAITSAGEPTRTLPLGFVSLPETVAFLLLCLILIGAPYGLSGFWPASLDMLAGAAYQPLAMLLGVTAGTCLLLALRPKSMAAAPVKRQLPGTTTLLLIGFFGWSCLAASSTVYVHDTLIELGRVGGCLAWFGIARVLLRVPRGDDSDNFLLRRFWLLSALIGGALIVCGIALTGFASALIQHGDPRQFSTFFNPNLFANFCAMALPLSLAWAILIAQGVKTRQLRLPSAIANALGFVAPLLIFMGLLASSSKGGLLAAVVGTVVFGGLLWRAKGDELGQTLRANLKVVTVVVFVLAVGCILAGKPLLSRLLAAHSTDDHSTMFRYYTWLGTLHMAAARPLFGWGPGSFPSAFPPFEITGNTMTAHQVWLQIAAENGVPALLLLIGASLVAITKGWHSLRGSDWPIAAGGIGGLAAFATHGLTDSGWDIVSIVLLFAVVMALLDTSVAPSSNPLPLAPNFQPAAPGIQWPWIGASLLLAVAGLGMERAAGGEDANYNAHDLIMKRETIQSLAKAREATEADPLSARAWLNRARIEDSVGEDATPAFARAASLQPSRAATWRAWAESSAQHGDATTARRYFDHAIAVDPNGTTTLLARANWLLNRADAPAQAQGWQDLEHIAALARQPYGKFPATPELVNLDFARAYAKLAARDLQADHKDVARDLVTRGLEDVARAHRYEGFQRQLASIGVGNITRNTDLNELETTLNQLKAQAQ